MALNAHLDKHITAGTAVGSRLALAAQTHHLTVIDTGALAQCTLRRKDGSLVRTNSLTPLITHGKGDETPYLWRDLGAKMLLVPYDNDMWMRYEAAALRAGRKRF